MSWVGSTPCYGPESKSDTSGVTTGNTTGLLQGSSMGNRGGAPGSSSSAPLCSRSHLLLPLG